MPPKVSKVSTENKDSSCFHQLSPGQFFLHGPRFIHVNNYFIFQIYILGKSMSFRYFAISFRDFVVLWFTNSPDTQGISKKSNRIESTFV